MKPGLQNPSLILEQQDLQQMLFARTGIQGIDYIASEYGTSHKASWPVVVEGTPSVNIKKLSSVQDSSLNFILTRLLWRSLRQKRETSLFVRRKGRGSELRSLSIKLSALLPYYYRNISFLKWGIPKRKSWVEAEIKSLIGIWRPFFDINLFEWGSASPHTSHFMHLSLMKGGTSCPTSLCHNRCFLCLKAHKSLIWFY